MKTLIWDGCYNDSWKGFITPKSFQHPAKYARGLIERIYDYCLTEGLLKPGDVVGDCFGGIATGGVTAAYRGLSWIGCELEPKFVALAQGNIDLHSWRLDTLGKPLPMIVQGDSRRFHEIVHDALSVIVTSPPYADSVNSSKSGIDWTKAERPERWQHGPNRNAVQASADHEMKYGEEPGQIGALKSGSLDAVVTSPPFLATEGGCKPKMGGVIDAKMMDRHNASADVRYGSDAAQIGNLKGGTIDGVVTSPPYSPNAKSDRTQEKRDKRRGFKQGAGGFRSSETFGDTEGQIGESNHESYWEAMAQVYSSCFLSLRPGGVICVVVKDYCQKGKRQRLCDDTLRLLEHVGFVGVARVHAMLVQEQTENDMFAGSVTKKKERKSFFRRLYESKVPEGDERRIDFEEVLVCRKP